jgi:hypothetical protein
MKAVLLGEGMIADAAEQQICDMSPHDALVFQKEIAIKINIRAAKAEVNLETISGK